jgi:spoIIIJ-associated protein
VTRVAPERKFDGTRPDDPGAGDAADPDLEDAPGPAADPVDVTRLADRMLRGLGLEVSCSARDEELTIEVDVEGPDRELLLDRKGEALNAVQYLLNRILYRGRNGKRIHVDSEGFRKQREEEIVEIAMLTAEKVRARGEESVLSPLNPYERRLVHLALQEVEGVETRSLGDGFLKRVAIVPVKRGRPGDAGGPDDAGGR